MYYLFAYRCRQLITFANSLDPDQNVGSDLDPNCLTLLVYSWKNFLDKVDLKEKNSRRQKGMQYMYYQELRQKV